MSSIEQYFFKEKYEFSTNRGDELQIVMTLK